MGKTALIVCGALAREALTLKEKHGWEVDLLGVPASLHNRPERIDTAVQKRIHEAREKYERIIVIYGDCGTGGRLDAMLAKEGVTRIAGPHCYEMYAGSQDFAALMAEEPGSYFLTDYLLRSFTSLVVKGMGLDRHPELRETYFRHYTRLVYLAQTDDAALREKAQEAADYLGLRLEIRPTGYGALERRLAGLMEPRRQSQPGEDSPYDYK